MSFLQMNWKWPRLLFGRSLRLLVLLLALTGVVSSCTGVNPLSFLKGGTNVAANTQVGRTNNQTIGTTKSNNPTVSVKDSVESIDQSIKEDSVSVDKTEQLTINYNVPIEWFMVVIGVLLLVVVAAVAGWIAPQPKWLRKN